MKKREYSKSEYTINELYPSRVTWHAEGVLSGQYGMVIKDLMALPINSHSDINQLTDIHHFLCKYYWEGSQDPERKKNLTEIGRRTMMWVRRNAEFISAQERPYHKRNMVIGELREHFENNLEGALVNELNQLMTGESFTAEFFEKLNMVFNLIWTTLELNSEEHQTIIDCIKQPESFFISRTIIPALFLGAMEYFDIEKLRILKECLEVSSNLSLRGSAIASLLILGRRHQAELLNLHYDFVEQVMELFQREDVQKLIVPTIKIITTSYKTPENHKIFREKILPKLTNLSDQLQQMMGNNLQERLDKLQEMDQDKMEEVERLMMESAGGNFSIMRDPDQDITYHMVTEMKKFPFFNDVSHWFMPYDARYPGIDAENAEALSHLAPILFQGRKIISSDMYSYAFVNAWKNVEEGLRIQMQGMPVPEPLPERDDFVTEVEDFVFGVFRFYHLSRFASGMVNPFSRKPYIADGAFLQRKGLVTEPDLYQLASLMVKYRQYGDAGRTYERMLCEYMTTSGEVYRGLAVASMMRGDDEKALEYLLRAVELEGKTVITTRKIAELMVRLGRKREAISWLEKGEEELTDDVALIAFDRAKILNEIGEWEEALQVGFKADFLADGASDEVIVFLSELLIQQDRADEALSLLDANGEEKGARLQMKGVALLALGQRSEGIECLTTWQYQGAQGATLAEQLKLLQIYGYEPWEQALIQDIVINRMIKDEAN